MRTRTRRGQFLLAVLLGCLAGAAFVAVSAQASKLKEEFAPFVDCPTSASEVCVVGSTTAGEFVMGNKTVPIVKTLTLQGGLPGGLVPHPGESLPLVGARDGNTLSKTQLEIPGGLLGIANIGGPVYATAEIAGPVSGVQVNQFELLAERGTAVVLPLKVKLDNPLLGEDCYIGSDSDPILLHLTTGTTSPPAPAKPISGKRGEASAAGGHRITVIQNNTLVDNTFAVPAATGCGTGLLAPIENGLVNLEAGLPAAAGRNTAVMSGSFIETSAANAAKHAKPPKEKKK